MKDIKVLGTGCANCKTTLKPIEDIQAIMSYGVMSTPGVVIDGKVVHAGGVPAKDKIAGWLVAPVKAGGCGCA